MWRFVVRALSVAMCCFYPRPRLANALVAVRPIGPMFVLTPHSFVVHARTFRLYGLSGVPICSRVYCRSIHGAFCIVGSSVFRSR